MHSELCCIIIGYVTIASALLGYDCGGTAANITSVSLLETADCNLPTTTPNQTKTYIQLLHLTDYDTTPVYQCRIEVNRVIYYCGMSSHISAVHNGRLVYLMDVSADVCKSIINTGTLSLNSFTQLTGLRVNTTDFRSVTLAGSIATDGKCLGTQYADTDGTWDGVVMQSVVRTNIRTYTETVRVKDNVISLRGNVQCTFSEGTCLTDENGSAFWTIIPKSACNFEQYTALYEGTATKIVSPVTISLLSTMYTVTEGDTTFALMGKEEHHLCGYSLITTEPPKLFILEKQRGRTFTSGAKITPNNMDLFAYVNSKFVYVERHHRDQLEALYHSVLQQRCNLEQQVIRNALALAAILPDVFAYTVMKKPGYMAVIGGEVAHIIKCTPVSVRVGHAAEFYRELPVTYQNTSMFLKPKSRILVGKGTGGSCSALLLQEYLVEGVWYQLLPKPTYVKDPQILEPDTEVLWKYTDAGSLATSGIYTQADLEHLRDPVILPIEQPSILNNIARGATGQKVQTETLNFMNFVSRNEFNKFAESFTSKVWNGLLKFGSVSAAIRGVMFIFKIIKLVVDSILRGYALHTVYGWSIHLLGAI
ncbi:hypothetical protein M0804_015560 [Polistes exclamans]|nr:hypothetical protein M0804_015560 [Polistes exclamans]